MGSAIVLMATVVTAEAVELRARCDYRGGSRERTRISVDAKDLAGGAHSVVVNGTYTASGTVTPPADEFEADFDSNPANVARGATEIPASLGAAGGATVELVGVLATTVSCPGEVIVAIP